MSEENLRKSNESSGIKGIESDLDSFLERMIEIEKDHVVSLSQVKELTGNDLFSALVDGIVHDSKKHTSLYSALLRIRRKDVAETINFNVEDDFIKSIGRNIDKEAEMVRELENVKSEDLNPLEKGFLSSILEDKRRHHVVLVALTKLLTSTSDRMDKYYILADALTNARERYRF